MSSKWWDINKILPYQRNFNLINGPRSIGKTYTCQKWLINRCLKEGSQFVYLVRYINERDEGAMREAFQKVIINEFQNLEFDFTNDTMYINNEEIGFCIALSESQKKKKRSYPLVNYILFDEYMKEEDSNIQYVKGWKEPDLLLSLYHTIDRDDDRVKVFMLGNNTSFYNPYHMHPAFNIQPVPPGGIWTSENVLYQYAQPSDELQAERSKSKFARMVSGSKYGKYAFEGKYVEDKLSFIAKHDGSARYRFTIICNDIHYGVYADLSKGLLYISDKVDKSCKFVYAITLEDHDENTMLTKIKRGNIEFLSQCLKLGLVRYENMYIKKAVEQDLYKLV